MRDGGGVKRTPHKSCTECASGYCAPNRCYCGHKECTSFHSYIRRDQIKAEALVSTAHHAKAWGNRQEETWLDQL